MTEYTLKIEITDTGLNTIGNAQQSVCLAKDVGTAGSTSNTARTVWVKIDPGENNVVTWEEDYRIYASESKIVDGAQVSSTTRTRDVVTLDYCYPFTKNNVFGEGTEDKDGEGYYSLHNGSNWTINEERQVCSGLYQVSTVSGGGNDTNDQGPLNACYVPYNEKGRFAPEEVVYVWAQKVADTGVVKEKVTTDMLKVEYDTGETSKTVHYDDTDNVFKPGPLPSR
ncbi:hypothetical protein [Kitasatospora sp. NPDC018619]|uniref:hypothetical protein n=1 Tax=unclassified Kitasatospora TaxID=2633591 RepID=UPI0037AA1818